MRCGEAADCHTASGKTGLGERRDSMELITITHDNIEQEHICCAIANNKDMQVMSKKKRLIWQALILN